MSPADDRDLVFPAGGGEMAALMRDQHWEQTPLGPVEHWPTALRAAVRMLLTSRFSMWMGWGDDLTFFYNDAYRADTLASKHPWALGQPAREVWREIWPEIGPRLAGVLADGRATWDESLLLMLERSGYREETYHTFSYSPLHEDDGRIRGVFCVVTEDTRRVISERRVGLLGKVAARTAGAKATEDLLSGLERALALDARDLPFTLTYLFDGGDRTPRLVSHTGFAPGGAAAHALDTGAAWLLRELEATSRVVEVALPPGAWPSGPWRAAPVRALVVPIAQQGQAQPAGAFVAGINPHRELDAAYREFVALLVGQIAAGLASAQAYAAERRRAESLAGARHDAEAANRAKDEFLAMLGHELRNPLAPILTALELMRLRPGVGAERERAVIERQVQHLVGLVDDLLDVSRITRGKVELRPEPLQVGDLIARAIEVVAPLLKEHRHLLSVDIAGGLAVHGDPTRLSQVMSNLLTNAAKYTPSGGRIAVRAWSDGDRAMISVTDNGIGIEPAMLERVFEPFAQARQAIDRAQGGLGLGLAIVDNLVKLHRGTVTAHSDGPGRGSVFTLALPLLGEPPVAREALPAPRATTASEARILIIDDNVDAAQLLADVLAAGGYDTLAAHDGPSALQAAEAFRPQIAVVDLGLPVMDGFELARLMLAEPALTGTKLVALTGYGQAEDRARTAAAGFEAHLVKPVDIEQLRGVIERLLPQP
jgi:signal transduction histidine kinase/CheY-like chemotaxis protein